MTTDFNKTNFKEMCNDYAINCGCIADQEAIEEAWEYAEQLGSFEYVDLDDLDKMFDIYEIK